MILVGGAVVVLTLLAWLLWPGRESFDLPENSTWFVEVVYEHSFAPLGDNAPPAGPSRYDGYVWDPEGPVVYQATGEPAPARATLTIGRRVAILSEPEHPARRDLFVEDDHEWSWDPSQTPDLDAMAFAGATGLLRLGTQIDLTEDDGLVIATVGEAEHEIRPGERLVIAEHEQTFTVEAYVDALRAFVPTLVPFTELSAETQALTARRLGADEDGRVTLRSRVWVIHGGAARWSDQDVLARRRAVQAAARRGDWDLAIEGLEALAEVVPGDREDRDLLDHVMVASEDGERRHRVHGSVQVPVFDETQAERQARRTSRLGPGRVAIARPGDPEGQFVAAAPLRDGRFECYLPPGTYRLVTYIPGFPQRTEEVDLAADRQIDFAFSIDDWRP